MLYTPGSGRLPGTLLLRKGTLETWEYWVLFALAIVLVCFLSYNLQALSDPGAASQHSQMSTLACAAAAVLVVALDSESHFVSSADQLFFSCNLTYIGFYLAMHWARLCNGYDSPIYIILIASLQLIASRFYSAAETLYNLVLIAILATSRWSVFLKIVLNREGQDLLVPTGSPNKIKQVPWYLVWSVGKIRGG